MTYPSAPGGYPNGDPHQGSQGYAPPPAYGAQPYGQLPSPQPAGDKVNPLAVASLIFGLTGCLSLFGVVLGISALRQIKRDGGRGRGLAITGITLGGLCNGIAAILIIVSFAHGS